MTLPISTGTYKIDTTHSQIGFAVKHLGISTVRGTFDSYRGELVVGASLADTSVTIEADMASVNSGNKFRDDHIQNADFFDTADHPMLEFRSTSVTEADDGYVLAGDLTIRGVTQPVSLAVLFNGSSPFPLDQSTHFGFEATGVISRSAFGVSYGVRMVSDDVRLQLDVQFVDPAKG